MRRVRQRGPDLPHLVLGQPRTPYNPIIAAAGPSSPARNPSPARAETPADLQTTGRGTNETPPDLQIRLPGQLSEDTPSDTSIRTPMEPNRRRNRDYVINSPERSFFPGLRSLATIPSTSPDTSGKDTDASPSSEAGPSSARSRRERDDDRPPLLPPPPLSGLLSEYTPTQLGSLGRARQALQARPQRTPPSEVRSRLFEFDPLADEPERSRRPSPSEASVSPPVGRAGMATPTPPREIPYVNPRPPSAFAGTRLNRQLARQHRNLPPPSTPPTGPLPPTPTSSANPRIERGLESQSQPRTQPSLESALRQVRSDPYTGVSPAQPFPHPDTQEYTFDPRTGRRTPIPRRPSTEPVPPSTLPNPHTTQRLQPQRRPSTQPNPNPPARGHPTPQRPQPQRSTSAQPPHPHSDPEQPSQIQRSTTAPLIPPPFHIPEQRGPSSAPQGSIMNRGRPVAPPRRSPESEEDYHFPDGQPLLELSPTGEYKYPPSLRVPLMPPSTLLPSALLVPPVRPARPITPLDETGVPFHPNTPAQAIIGRPSDENRGREREKSLPTPPERSESSFGSETAAVIDPEAEAEERRLNRLRKGKGKARDMGSDMDPTPGAGSSTPSRPQPNPLASLSPDMPLPPRPIQWGFDEPRNFTVTGRYPPLNLRPRDEARTVRPPNPTQPPIPGVERPHTQEVAGCVIIDATPARTARNRSASETLPARPPRTSPRFAEGNPQILPILRLRPEIPGTPRTFTRAQGNEILGQHQYRPAPPPPGPRIPIMGLPVSPRPGGARILGYAEPGTDLSFIPPPTSAQTRSPPRQSSLTQTRGTNPVPLARHPFATQRELSPVAEAGPSIPAVRFAPPAPASQPSTGHSGFLNAGMSTPSGAKLIGGELDYVEYHEPIPGVPAPHPFGIFRINPPPKNAEAGPSSPSEPELPSVFETPTPSPHHDRTGVFGQLQAAAASTANLGAQVNTREQKKLDKAREKAEKARAKAEAKAKAKEDKDRKKDKDKDKDKDNDRDRGNRGRIS